MSFPSRAARRALPLAAVLGAAVIVPAAADAATVASPGGALDYRGSPGEVNNVRMFMESGRVTLTDTAPIRAGSGCFAVTVRKARCGTSARTANFQLGDRNDSTLLQVAAAELSFVNGGADADRFVAGLVQGGTSRYVYDGGPGNDRVSYASADRGVRISADNRSGDGRIGVDRESVASTVEQYEGSQFGDIISGTEAPNAIHGNGGADALSGRGGDDFFFEGASANGGDFISGGGGRDAVLYHERTAPLSITLDGLDNDGAAGEGDNVRSDVELVHGGRGADTLTGDAGANELLGAEGADRIAGLGGDDFLAGGSGRDSVAGGPGEDSLALADLEGDFADCGPDRDVVSVDAGALDLRANCETVRALPGVGRLALTPRTVKARTGRTAIVDLTWTHPVRWTQLDEVELRLHHGGRRVGRVTFDQETGRLAATGPAIRLIADRSRIASARPGARRIRLRLALRVSRRYAGRTLMARVAATDDGGLRQPARRAGRITVAPR